MEHRPLKRLGAMIASGVAFLMLVGCNGSTGQPGTNGSNGNNGAAPINVGQMTQDTWAAAALTGTVTGVTFVGADQGTPQVSFTVTTSDGTPVAGLSANVTHRSTDPAGQNTYPNFEFSIAKLANQAGGATQWTSYIVSSTPTTTAVAAPTRPTTDTTGTLTEDGKGGYTYTFSRDIATMASFVANYTGYVSPQSAAQLGDLTFDKSLTHRITVMVGGALRGTSTNTSDGSAGGPAVYLKHAANIIYDFIPATGQAAPDASTRRITNAAACNACHTTLGATFHTGGNRNDPNYCVMCHNDQMKYGYADASTTLTGNTFPGSTTKVMNLYGLGTGNMPAFIHRMHNGSENYYQNFKWDSSVTFNNVTYPQDVRNCTTCHVTSSTTPQADNWKTKPGIVACGSCHDSINIPNGVGHVAQQNDAQCSACHSAKDIQIEHTPILPASAVSSYGTTATWFQATNPGLLPTGAHSISAVISSVQVVPISGDTTNLGNPKITFSLYADGDTAHPLNLRSASSTSDVAMLDTLVADPAASFVGGPNIIVAMGYPQDGIAPADYNWETTMPLVKIWNNSATGTKVGTLANPSPGVYTVTLTKVVVPSGTNLLIAGIGDGNNLVQTNLGKISANADKPEVVPTTDLTWNSSTGGGLLVPIQTVWKNATAFSVTYGGTTKSIARRTIVTTDACNSCHSNLGAFTSETFHSQAYNDAQSCAICHNTSGGPHPNAAGFSINAKDWVHGLHAAAFRSTAYNAQTNFTTITYPGLLNNCEACHVPGSYDFSNTTNANQVPNMLWDTIAGTLDSTMTPVQSYWVAAGTYGTGFNYTAGATLPGTVAQPSTGSLVVSPITAACTGCHDTSQAISHMTGNGGVFYSARSSVPVPANKPTSVTVNGLTQTPLYNAEQCLVCHGAGGVADIRKVHMNF